MFEKKTSSLRKNTHPNQTGEYQTNRYLNSLIYHLSGRTYFVFSRGDFTIHTLFPSNGICTSCTSCSGNGTAIANNTHSALVATISKFFIFAMCVWMSVCRSLVLAWCFFFFFWVRVFICMDERSVFLFSRYWQRVDAMLFKF